MSDGTQQRIVVGVDGSDSSKAALRWAIEQAKATGATIDAVTAWWMPSSYGIAPFTGSVDIDLEGESRKLLSDSITEVGGLEPEVPVRPIVSQGHAADVLLRAAEDADLLVVGSRGHGRFASAMVDSVSLNCVLQAHCPVLVLRGEGPHDN